MNIPSTSRILRFTAKLTTGIALLSSSIIASAVGIPEKLDPGVNVSDPNPTTIFFYFPSFSWEPVQGAASYRIQIAEDGKFASGLIEATTLIERYVHGSPLSDGASERTIFWRVRSVDAEGSLGEWSETRHLKLPPPSTSETILTSDCLATIQQKIVRSSTSSVPAILHFSPGTYAIDIGPGQRLFDFAGVSDLIVDGGGSTIKLRTTGTTPGTVPPAFSRLTADCRNITFRNFKIDYDPYLNAWGTVEEKSGSELKVKRDANSQPFDSAWLKESTSILVLRGAPAAQRYWLKEGYASLYTVSKDLITETSGTASLLVTTVQVTDIKVGDMILLPCRRIPLNETQKATNVAYYQMTNYAAAGSSYKPLWSENVHILQCSATVLSSRPSGGSADGVHAQGNKNGPWVEGCTFRGLGDDAFAYYQRAIEITAQSSTTIDVTDPNRILEPGDKIRIFNPRDGLIQADDLVITQITEPDNKRRTITLDPPLAYNCFTGTYLKPDQVFTKNKNNGRFYIKNNTVDGDRGKALVMRCDNGIIVGNAIRGASRSAIAFHNEPAADNGLESWNIRIEGNTIEDCGWERMSHVNGMIMFENQDTAGVSATALHRNIKILGNTIHYWQERAIMVSNVNGFTIADNTISADPDDAFLFPDPIGIEVKTSGDGLVSGNDLLKDPRSFTPISVTGSTDVAQAVILDNTSATGVARSGAWNTSTATGCYGPNALYRGPSASSWVKFTPAIPSAGTYEIFAKWSAHSNRATNTAIKICDKSGSVTTKYVNQEINGGVWYSLGAYELGTGADAGYVMVSAGGANENVVADAVQWVPVP